MKWFGDVRFYIIVFFLTRLWGITHPPLDGNHGWRQAQTCMVARNMVEVENNPLYPRADQFGGDKTGIFGSEFPLLQECIAGISFIAGYDHWYGRLINLIITSIGIYCFYLFLRRFTLEHIALITTILLQASVWFMFGRKIMPDTFSLALMMTGLYLAVRYLDEHKPWQLFAYTLLIAAGGLSKIPSTFMVAGVVPFLLLGPAPLLQKMLTGAGTVLAAGLIWWWYFVWDPHLVSTFGANIMFVKSIREGLQEILPQGKALFRNLTFNGTQSYLFSLLVLPGLWLVWKKERQLFWPLMTSILFLILYTLKVGGVFPVHNYYMIPYAVVFALLAAVTTYHLIAPKWRHWLVICIVAECLINQYWDLAYPVRRDYKLRLEVLLNGLAARNETVAFVSDDNPSEMYFAHRRGWLLWPEQATDPQKLQELSSKGCSLLVVNQVNYQNVVPPLPEVHRDEHYTVYAFRP